MGELRMYEPYGFQDNYAYLSKKAQIEGELRFNRWADSKEFTSVEYNTSLQAFVFRNIFGKAVGQIDLKNIIVSELLDGETTYDKEKKCIVLVFKSGQTVEIPVYDLMDIAEAGDGLTNDGQYYHVLIDELSELSDVDGKPFLTVNDKGVKIEGIDLIVQVERERAKSEEARLDKRVDDEIARAKEAEEILNQLIATETSRAIERENQIENKFDTIIGPGFSTADTETVTYRYEELSEYLQQEVDKRLSTDTELISRIDNLNSKISLLSSMIDNMQAQITFANIQGLNQKINDVNVELLGRLQTVTSALQNLQGRVSSLESASN